MLIAKFSGIMDLHTSEYYLLFVKRDSHQNNQTKYQLLKTFVIMID